MASTPKKAHRPAIRPVPPRPAAVVVEPPAPPVSDISAATLQAVEVLPPVAEPVAPAPVAEAAQPVVEVPVQVAPPAQLEAAAPAVSVLTGKTPLGVMPFGENLRAMVEKGLVESRAKFAQAKAVAEEASAAVEASCDAARDGVVAFNVKTIEALKAGADANFDLVVSLASAKSVSELVTLQSEFARKRFEETSSHAKALAELARKVADETVAPIKAHVAKAFKTAV